METIDPNRDCIAVYGSLMRVHGAQDLAGTTDKLRFLGECRIPGQLYDLGEFPGLVPGPDEVAGELYRIEHADALPLLDDYEAFYESNPSQSLFVRRRIRLNQPPIDCWVYFFNQEPKGNPKVEGGNWTEYLRLQGRPMRVTPVPYTEPR